MFSNHRLRPFRIYKSFPPIIGEKEEIDNTKVVRREIKNLKKYTNQRHHKNRREFIGDKLDK